MGAPIGYQDQYIAAFGGVRLIRYRPSAAVEVNENLINRPALAGFADHLLLYRLPGSRNASNVLRTMSELMEEKRRSYCRMAECAEELARHFAEAATFDCQLTAAIINENWRLKRGLSPAICPPHVAEFLDAARARGAMAGKLLGAGGTGFAMVIAPPAAHRRLAAEFPALTQLKVRFTSQGAAAAPGRRAP